MSQSRSRSDSHSGSVSGSRSSRSSRSSSNSMRLPEPSVEEVLHNDAEQVAAPPAAATAAAATGVEAAAAATVPAVAEDVASVFIGMGPGGRFVSVAELTEFLKSKAMEPSNVKDVRLRGRCAFADTTTVEEARHLIAQLDGHNYLDKFRMAVQMSRQTMAEAAESKRARQDTARPTPATAAAEEARPVNDGRQVFVNLGPAGKDISNDIVRGRLEAICPIMRFERRGYCVYADVPSKEDTKRVVAAMHNTMIGDVRLIVQMSTVRRKREREPQAQRLQQHQQHQQLRGRDGYRDGYRGGPGGALGDRYGRDPRRLSHRSRSRSGSRDGRRRHRRSRRSYTPSSRSVSSYSSRSRSHSRGRRSYSPDSVDSRDRRGGRRGGDSRRRGDRAERTDRVERVDRRDRRGSDRRERR